MSAMEQSDVSHPGPCVSNRQRTRIISFDNELGLQLAHFEGPKAIKSMGPEGGAA
jgi:hypothetical protein